MTSPSVTKAVFLPKNPRIHRAGSPVIEFLRGRLNLRQFFATFRVAHPVL
jgi:hypothetical protein